MKIRINGEEKEIKEGLSLAALLDEFQIRRAASSWSSIVRS